MNPLQDQNEAVRDTDIAIVGLSGRFPSAGSVEAFWKNLCDGTESIRFFDDAELERAGYPAEALANSHMVKAASILDGIELFDAEFFGYTPREAELMDPQQRLFLECAWEALEDAGHTSQNFPGLIGVFAGSGINTYLMTLANSQGGDLSLNGLQLTIGNDKDYLATRVSYKLNLTGPSVCVQTACSTSLVSVHLACQSLIDFECDMALAGGVSVRAPQPLAYRYIEDGIASPDGHCRTFDAKAQGTIFGNGLGLVVLRRLADALEDGDHIYAVIRGTAINNDGFQKVGYTAPSFDGQARVIRAALAAAEVEPASISYLEAHGTGTALGDSIEIGALKQVFGQANGHKCAIGAVKTNVGHLDTAAGVTGLIKTVLCLKHHVIPPTLHFEKGNPALQLEQSPFHVTTQLTPWRGDGSVPRRAGVSSFGIGGTNAHAVLEEAPPRPEPESSRSHHLIVISGRSHEAVQAARANLAGHLRAHPELPLADVAYTTQTGRVPHNHRDAVACRSIDDAIAALERNYAPLDEADDDPSAGPSLVFMFPGQGAQHPNMAVEIYRTEPLFRKYVDHCAELFTPHLERDIRGILYPEPGKEGAAAETLRQTAYAQPALFTVEYALAQLWMEWGVRPQAMIGHSLGELVAACLAGVMSLADAVRIVAARARLMQAQPSGAMLAVSLSEREARALCGEQLSLAAVNAPALCVISGAQEKIEELQRELGKKQVGSRILVTSHAYHSSLMDGAIAPLRQAFEGITLREPRIPLINVHGKWMQAAEATDPRYWASQLRSTVQFSQGIQTVAQLSRPMLLEMGPMQTLCKISRQHRGSQSVTALPSLPEPEEGASDFKTLITALGELWRRRINIDWKRFHQDERRYRVPLPKYPFQRKRYWLGETKPGQSGAKAKGKPERAPMEEWFYLAEWKQSAPAHFLAPRQLAREKSWLLLIDGQGLGREIATQLRSGGQTVLEVMAGESFQEHSDGSFSVCPSRASDYRQLFAALIQRNQLPHTIGHFWNITDERTQELTSQAFDQAQQSGMESLLYLAQAARQLPAPDAIELFVFANHLAPIFNQRVQSEKATLLGICRVMPQEYPSISCRVVDVQPASGPALAVQLAEEMGRKSPWEMIAYRGPQRWTQEYRRFPLGAPQYEGSVFRERGVYLITGGLGGLGLGLARSLAERYKPRLALVRRSPASAEDAGERERQERIRELESMGAEVLVLAADVTSREQLASAVRQVRERWGAIHGVFHLAGTPGGGLMDMADAQAMAKVLAPKTSGTFLLQQAVQDDALDFLVLFSSITSITGGLGQADYCAANAFLNAFPSDQALRAKYPVIAVAWDAWQSDTWQESSFKNLPAVRKALKEYRQKYGITFAEGFAVLERAIAARLPNILISTRDLNESIEVHRAYAHSVMAAGSQRKSEMQLSETARGENHAPPRNAAEQKILEIWKEVLGLEAIGVHDSFIDLGGHSLLAIQLTARLRQEFQTDVGLKTIFERPTIAGQAELLDQGAARAASNEEELLRLIDEIDNLSAEEVQQKLAEAGH
jgi:acyl transferase domain-containing protein/aryl carrier-like protein